MTGNYFLKNCRSIAVDANIFQIFSDRMGSENITQDIYFKLTHRYLLEINLCKNSLKKISNKLNAFSANRRIYFFCFLNSFRNVVLHWQYDDCFLMKPNCIATQKIKLIQCWNSILSSSTETYYC